MPVGARIATEAVLPYQAIAAEEVLARMESAGQGKSLNIMILDACRNASFMRGWRSPVDGLAPMHVSGGSLIAYATAPGAVAKDGAGRNGTYTRHLLRFMREPNLPIELMFKQVRVAVEQDTNGEQSPWETSSLRQDFAFHSVARGATPTPAPAVEIPARPIPPRPSEPTLVDVGLYLTIREDIKQIFAIFGAHAGGRRSLPPSAPDPSGDYPGAGWGGDGPGASRGVPHEQR